MFSPSQLKNSVQNTDDLNFFQKIFDSSQENKYGYASLIRSLSSLKKFLPKLELNFSTGIVLGKIGSKFIRSDRPYSCLVLAPPGTGKTAGIVIPNLLLCEHSMVVHDPKGELYSITHKVRRDKLKNKILLFDPVADDSLKFNIFAKDMLPDDTNDLRAYVANAANIIFAGQQIKNNSSSADGYFESAAKSTFTFFAQWLIYKNGQTSIPQIRSKLLEDEDTTKTIEAMVEDDSTPLEIQEDGRGVLTASVSENQWAGIIGQLKEALELFADSRIKNVTDSTCDFTGHTLRKERTTVYLNVQDKDKQRLRPIMSLMLDSISTQLVSRMPDEDSNQITFVLDEFVRLGKMDFISDLPSISRGYKLNFIFVAQDYEQISNTYGQSYISIFETNCAYKIVFRQNNYTTAERISKLIGNRTTTRISTSRNQSNKGDLKISLQNSSGKSKSTSSEGISLITPQDILNLHSDNCLLLVQGHAGKPILARSPMWFQEKELTKLIQR